MADRWDAGTVELQWEPEHALCLLTVPAGAHPTAADARAAQAWIDERARGAPFRILVDLRGADAVTLLWRYRWMGWAYHHRRRLQATMIEADPETMAVVTMFARATEVRFRAFSCESDARAWLLASPLEAKA